MASLEPIGPIAKRVLKKARQRVYHPSEADEQMAVVSWVRLMAAQEPRLNLLFATNNGVPLSGPRRFAVVNWLKKMGMSPGVPDLMLPVWGVHGAPGWAAEMKHKDWKGSLPDDEEDWRVWLSTQGWVVVSPCRGATEAIASLKGYLEIK